MQTLECEGRDGNGARTRNENFQVQNKIYDED